MTCVSSAARNEHCRAPDPVTQLHSRACARDSLSQDPTSIGTCLSPGTLREHLSLIPMVSLIVQALLPAPQHLLHFPQMLLTPFCPHPNFQTFPGVSSTGPVPPRNELSVKTCTQTGLGQFWWWKGTKWGREVWSRGQPCQDMGMHPPPDEVT